MRQPTFNDTRFIATINSWVPKGIDEYINIERDNTGEIKPEFLENQETTERAESLAIALRKLADTQSTEDSAPEITALNIEEGDELDFFIGIIDDPTKIGHHPTSTKAQLKDFISERLVFFADTICREYSIEVSKTQPTTSARTAIEEQHPNSHHSYIINLSAELRQSNSLYETRKKPLDIFTDSAKVASFGCFGIGFFLLECMTNIIVVEAEAFLFMLAVPAAFFVLGAVITAATYTLLAISLTFAYGGIHLYDSLAKMTRVFSQPFANTLIGFANTALTLSGTAGATFGGLIAGTLLGAAVPAIGTLVGAILGASMCGIVGIGIAAFLSKHIVNALRPNNKPDKAQQQRLENMGVDTDELCNLIIHLQTMKKDVPLLSRIYPNDSGRQFKWKINGLIEDLKNGLINEENVRVDGKNFKLFKPDTTFIQEQRARQEAYHLHNMPSAPPLEEEDRLAPSAPPMTC